MDCSSNNNKGWGTRIYFSNNLQSRHLYYLFSPHSLSCNSTLPATKKIKYNYIWLKQNGSFATVHAHTKHYGVDICSGASRAHELFFFGRKDAFLNLYGWNDKGMVVSGCWLHRAREFESPWQHIFGQFTWL